MLKMQLKVMFSRWEFWVVFLLCMALAIWGVYDAKHWPISYASAEYQYMGNAYSVAYSYFMILFPFLVVVPFAASFVDDLSKKTFAAMIYRGGIREYLRSKYIAVFVGNALFVLIPFLVNLILCYLLFPINREIPFGGWGNVISLLFGTGGSVRTLHPYNPIAFLIFKSHLLFYLAYLLQLTIVSGVFGCFVLSVSIWIRKHWILLFLPLFVLTKIAEVFSAESYNRALGGNQIFLNLELMNYLAPFGLGGIFWPLLILLLLLMILFSVISYFYLCKKEYLYV